MRKFRDRLKDLVAGGNSSGDNSATVVPPSVQWSEVKEPVGPAEPTVLPGALDPVCASELRPGEKIFFCTNCRSGFHKDCWEFLKRWNASKCVTCGQWGTFLTMTVPAALPKGQGNAEEERAIIACPKCSAPNRIRTGRPVEGYRCGKCLEPLFSIVPNSAPSGNGPRP